jgi:hypothetical protein
MAIEKENNDIDHHKSKGNMEHDEDERLDVQATREGLRLHICASRLRRFRPCACGRARALAKRGHRWRRLSACSHCLRISGATSRLVGMTSCKERGDD